MIIEIAIFRLVDSADEAQLLRDSELVQNGFLARQPSFAGKRMLSKVESGQWVDMVFWTNLEDALKAAEIVEDDPAMQPFLQATEHGHGGTDPREHPEREVGLANKSIDSYVSKRVALCHGLKQRLCLAWLEWRVS